MKKRILLVEDNATNQKLMERIVVGAGYDMVSADNADEAIEVALRESFDLVVMDIQLPGTDGLTAVRLLRGHEKTRHLPVLAVTAHAMQGDEQKILGAGCNRYLSKPVSYRALLAAIEELLVEGR